MATRIVTIAENPALVPQIAQWLWTEWGHRRGRTLEMVTRRLAARAASGGPEQTFVIVDGATPLATASYTAADLASRPDLTPWLASVFVDPPHRGHGHATSLVRRVEQAAQAAGTETLWLYTEHAEGLYAGLGWETVGLERDLGAAVTLMRRRLSGLRPATPTD